jgi:lipopolysaccharide biosynthesis regulator YciM
MDFDLQWLLIGLPVAFALGWLASRFDLRQFKRQITRRAAAYFKGLNLLLNEQQDKAIDAFIEAVQNDPDTTELHFALGNLFRRRGEFERAVRVHQHLLQRADLPAERDRAQHALAQDYLKAGLFDRAEQAYRALDGSRLRGRGAAGAADAVRTLARLDARHRGGRADRSRRRRLAPRMAHYWCELAAGGRRARRPPRTPRRPAAGPPAPHRPRPLVLAGQRLARRPPLQRWPAWDELRRASPAFRAGGGRLRRRRAACGRAAAHARR